MALRNKINLRDMVLLALVVERPGITARPLIIRYNRLWAYGARLFDREQPRIRYLMPSGARAIMRLRQHTRWSRFMVRNKLIERGARGVQATERGAAFVEYLKLQYGTDVSAWPVSLPINDDGSIGDWKESASGEEAVPSPAFPGASVKSGQHRPRGHMHATHGPRRSRRTRR